MTVTLEPPVRTDVSVLHHIAVRTTRGTSTVGVLAAYRDSAFPGRIIAILDRVAAEGMPDARYGYLSVLAQPIGQMMQRPEARLGAAIEAKAGSDAVWPVHETSPVLSVDTLLALPADTPYRYDHTPPHRATITRMSDAEVRALPAQLMALVEYRHEGSVFRW